MGRITREMLAIWLIDRRNALSLKIGFIGIENRSTKKPKESIGRIQSAQGMDSEWVTPVVVGTARALRKQFNLSTTGVDIALKDAHALRLKDKFYLMPMRNTLEYPSHITETDISRAHPRKSRVKQK